MVTIGGVYEQLNIHDAFKSLAHWNPNRRSASIKNSWYIANNKNYNSLMFLKNNYDFGVERDRIKLYTTLTIVFY